MICLTCAELQRKTWRAGCRSCGTRLLPLTRENLDLLVQMRVRRGILGAAGELDEATRKRLDLQFPEPAIETTIHSAEERADALAGKLPDSDDLVPEWFGEVEKLFRERPDPIDERPLRSELEEAGNTGQSLFRSGASDGALTGGLDALASLDEAHDQGLLPLVNEYVWWFLGTLLVLGGSVMGVREAWKALAGVPRQIIVAGALFAYHAGFIALGAVVARRSASAGRVLGSIGLGLLPVVFAALSALVGLSPSVGFFVSGAALLVSGMSLRGLAQRFEGAPAAALAMAVLPSLAAELPLSMPDLPLFVRALLPLTGMAAVGLAARRGFGVVPVASPFAILASAAFAALALCGFALIGAPGTPVLDLSAGGVGFSSLSLWALLLAGLLSGAAASPRARESHPGAAATLETVLLGVVLCASVAGGAGAFQLQPAEAPILSAIFALTPALGALFFVLVQPRRRAALHPAVLLATGAAILLARLEAPGDPAFWAVGAAATGSALLFLARGVKDDRDRALLFAWGVLLSLSSLGGASLLEAPVSGAPWLATLQAAALVALAAHLCGAVARPGLHYLGGIGALSACAAFIPALPDPSSSRVALIGGAGLVYGLAALLWDRFTRADRRHRDLLPLDDVALFAGLLAGWLELGSPASRMLFSVPALEEGLLRHVPAFAAGLLLLIRSLRDRSRLVSAAGATLVGYALLAVSGAGSQSQVAVTLASLALAAGLVASLRGEPAQLHGGRKLFGFLKLPLAAPPRPLLTDGFAAASLLATLLGVVALASWLGAQQERDRALSVEAGEILVLAALLAFGSRGFAAFRLRGALVTFSSAAVIFVITALVNRVGRPLPPQVIGLRFTFIVPALWLFAIALRRFGPALGRALDNEPDGRRYHLVPHLGVGALGLLLAVDALLVGLPDPTRALVIVPPLLLVGSSLAWLLLARSFRSPLLLNAGLALLLPGGALIAAQRALTGPELVPFLPPAAQWVPLAGVAAARLSGWLSPAAFLSAGDTVVAIWQRAALGVAGSGATLAISALLIALGAAPLAAWRKPEILEEPMLAQGLTRWAAIAALLIGLGALVQPVLPAALLVVLIGVSLRLAGARPEGSSITALSVLLVHSAGVHQQVSRVPDWAGPALAALALLMVSLTPLVAKIRKASPQRTRERLHPLALLYGAAGLCWALATGGVTDPLSAAPQIASDVFLGLAGAWLGSPALTLTLTLAALALAVSAIQWRGTLSSLIAFSGVATAGLASVTAVSWAQRSAVLSSGDPYSALLINLGAPIALALALGALASHGAAVLLVAGRRDLEQGLGAGRDLLVVEAGAVLAIFSATGLRSATGLEEGLFALAALFAVALHAAFRGKAGRHVYFAQVAVVATYALVTAQLDVRLPPAADSTFALVLAFILVGVTVLARRSGVTPVADATRRFAALLPVLVAVLMPGETSRQAALLAAGTGLFYATLASAERSRLFGALAAFAGNLALLLAALAEGLSGIEIFLAPLGLLILMLGQLFAKSLPRAARNGVRIVGGLLLYAPAAVKLSLQLGQASQAGYAVVFGGACLLGVAAGMLLQIRAYLAMGTLFVTLDVVANLVNAGIRDHRIGFLVLSGAGLSILGGMVFTTLRAEDVRRLVAAFRRRLAGWE